MPQLVMYGNEVLVADLDAHFDAQVVLEIGIPGASVADDITVFGFSEKRPLPESWRQRVEAQGSVEVLSVLDHTLGVEILTVDLLILEQCGQVEAAAILR